MKKFLSLIFVLALSASLLFGCASLPQASIPAEKVHAAESATQISIQPEFSTGGVLCLKINPEIALHYDENGKVTKLEGRNPDGTRILENISGYVGKDAQQVLADLVQLIGKAGYFVEEADGTARRIVLELDPGSQVPHDQFLADMAAHVKACVESKSWVGEREYEYNGNVVPAPTEPAPTEPAATEPAPAKKETSSTNTKKSTSTVPDGLCPVCADDDCNDGKYCDDAHEKAENLRAYERLMSGDVCPTCGDYDCDDGKFCDDADEKAENLREAENRKNGVRCSVCGDYDCDDGKYCDDWDDRHDDHHDD